MWKKAHSKFHVKIFFYLLGVENFFSLGIKPNPSAVAYGHGDGQEMTVTNPQVNRLAH